MKGNREPLKVFELKRGALEPERGGCRKVALRREEKDKETPTEIFRPSVFRVNKVLFQDFSTRQFKRRVRRSRGGPAENESD